MRMLSALPVQGTTSAPTDGFATTGQGSITAVLYSRGVAFSRYTPQGSMQPFGQETGTADDNAVVFGRDTRTGAEA